MKKILVGVGILLVVVIAAIIAAPFIVPVQAIKARVVEQVEQATGRKLTIAGDVKLSVFPSLSVDAGQVTLSNAAGAAERNMVSLAKLQVALKLMPLLSGEIAVDQFVLVDPVINLEVDRNGRANWQFAAPPPPGRPAPAQPGAQGGSSGGGPAAMLQQVRLGDVRLVNGKVTYRDAKANKTETIDKINVKLSLPAIDKPFNADGALDWNGKTVKLEAQVASLAAILEEKASNVGLKVASEPVNFTFGGSVKTGPALTVGGDIDLNVPSVRNLAAWTGNPLTMQGNTFGPLAIKGKLAVNGPKVAFQNAALSLDALRAKGNFEFDGSGARPYAKAQLDTEMLDLNPYLPPEQKAAAKPAGGAGGQGQQAAAANDDWSDEPLDLSGLRAADADLALNVAGIKVRKIEVGKSALNVALKGGRMTADLAELNIYEGKGKGRVVLDGSGQGAGVQSNFSLAGLQIGPLLAAAADSNMMTGKGALDFEVTGRGNSQRQLISALNGKGDVKLNDGAVKGIDFVRVLCDPMEALKALGGRADANSQTPFSELGLTYTIANGIVTNKDLAMLGPLFRVEGAGTVDLPNRTVNYRPVPKLVGSCSGQGSSLAKPGLAVPVKVTGPWSNVSIQPDFNPADLLKSINPADALKNPGDALKNVLPGLGGGSTTQQPQQGGTTTQQKPATGGIGGVLRGLGR
jgi:AsmA protein